MYELAITEQKLIDGIAKEGATAYFEMWDKLSEEQRNYWRIWARERIYPLIKECESYFLNKIL